MTNKKVVVRFAPSPTGQLHVGGLRTALFNFLYAKKTKGQFVLRIEDTDQSREVAGAAEKIQNILREFGLNWDKGPIFQSQRLPIYQKLAKELLEKGAVYEDEGAIRQKIPKEGITTFEDLVYGKIGFENRKLDEGVLLKADGFPVYNFANVVDDHEMGITHVIRGEEFIPSTPKHILLYQSLNWEVPNFVHLPLILDKQRKKLSKRTGDVAVTEYLNLGYLKPALLNFLALLGWNPKTTEEIFSLEDLIQAFDLSKINKAGAIFDLEKLDFINREWQKRLPEYSLDPMYKKTLEIFIQENVKINESLLQTIWPQITERVRGPGELKNKLPEFSFYFNEPNYDESLLIWKDTSVYQTKEALQTSLNLLKTLPSPVSENQVEKMFFAKIGLGNKGEILWPLRIALTGLKNSPGPFEIISAFSNHPDGQNTIQKRIQKALEKLEKM